MKEAIIKVVIIKSKVPLIVDRFEAKITEKNQLLARRKLEKHKEDIIKILKEFKSQGIIKSVFIPKSKNRKVQADLDRLVKIKTDINKSLGIIKEVFGK
jgi:hypothetical protein